jgi:alanyl-tRNA synthetase
LKVEEERFYETLEIGMQILDEALGDGASLPFKSSAAKQKTLR